MNTEAWPNLDLAVKNNGGTAECDHPDTVGNSGITDGGMNVYRISRGFRDGAEHDTASMDHGSYQFRVRLPMYLSPLSLSECTESAKRAIPRLRDPRPQRGANSRNL